MRFQLRDMKGLTPAIDPTVSDEVYALNGQNFVFDTKGVRAVFGNRLLLPQPRSKPQYAQGIRLKLRTGDRCFTLDGDGIWEWSETLGGWKSIFLTPDTTLAPYRWSSGFLDNKMYFCHPRVGIVVYDLDSELCRPHEEVGIATPEEALAITVNNGRLCVVSPRFFSWSRPSDGLNFNPGLGQAGSQVISDRVPGAPIMVTSYAGGCLTWTTGGVLRSEFTGDQFVYRHRSLGTEYRPANSFCIVRVDDDSSIILDERGLFQSRGENLTPYAPIFNEFLLDYIQKNNLKVGENLRIEWDELQRRLYVSISLSYANPLYERAFVLYNPLDKWGSFDEPHYGVLPLQITGSQRADDYYGFVDGAGCVRYWQVTGSREKATADSDFDSANLYYPAIQKPQNYNEVDEGAELSSTGKLSTFSRVGMTQRAGYYAAGVTTPLSPQLHGLGAKIQFGLFRPSDNSAPDAMTEINGVVVRSIESGDPDVISVDFNLVPSGTADEDYNIEPGSQDYGIDGINYVNHRLKIISTIDASTEFMSVEPELVAFVKGARYYSCSINGIWHIMEVEAVDVGESFHIKTFEFNAVGAGRLL